MANMRQLRGIQKSFIWL